MWWMLFGCVVGAVPWGEAPQGGVDDGGSIPIIEDTGGDIADEWSGGGVQFVSVHSPLPEGVTPAASGDIDRDGSIDLVAWTRDGSLILLRGDGVGGFSFTVPVWSSLLTDIIAERLGEQRIVADDFQVMDLDGDGVLDFSLFILPVSGATPRLVAIRGPDYLSVEVLATVPEETSWSRVHPLPDLDRDGLAELLWLSDQTQDLRLSGGGGSRYTSAETYHYASRGTVLDYDGDGDQDVAVIHNGGYGYDGISVAVQTTAGWAWTPYQRFGFSSTFAADDDELLLPDHDGLMRLQPSGATILQRPVEAHFAPQAIADFNRDSRLDVLSVASDGGVQLWAGQEDGELTDVTVEGWSHASVALIADVDQDGRSDIVHVLDDALVVSLARPLRD
ncbi:MAG: VCBS repeat-containing protein [Myxococcota bacterium]